MRALAAPALTLTFLLQIACGPVMARNQEGTLLDVLASSVEPITLTAEPRELRLQPQANWRGQILTRIESLGRGERLFIVLRGKHATDPPSALFEVRVGSLTDTAPSRPIGRVNFYNARPGRNGGSAGADDVFESFEVTDWAGDAARRAALANLRITITPVGPVERGADATIDRIQLVVQR